ncbi:MAG: flavodoxin-dependent (E)-4-hydroxy-3-methylbut-2-enyl-diphosphate synthase, partial [Clostridia bacterium]|nr:flavodoxin-dependent (E)-4-hydroxy-3-methylbut-2-enyl-diphosphate synthase [Clostridia bacterium]
MIKRSIKKEIMVGNVPLGGQNPVAVQSMTNTDTLDSDATTMQLKALEAAGCDIARISFYNYECVEGIVRFRSETRMPLVADIHYDYKIAVACIEAGIDKIRINPGNIGGPEKVREIVKAASERNIPIRVGVNAGSLRPELYDKYGGPTEEAMMEDLGRQIAVIEDFGYTNLVIAAKSSDIGTMVSVNRMMDEKYEYPIHLGLTEAGTVFSGTIKSSAALGILLSEGIGDTIRYSLTGDPVEEVRAANVLLRSMGLNKKGINIISCPTCGRTKVDIIKIADELEKLTYGIKADLDVAVMGCGVNGPNEARHADLGMAGGNGKAVLFRKGEIFKTVREEDALDELLHMIKEIDRK